MGDQRCPHSKQHSEFLNKFWVLFLEQYFKEQEPFACDPMDRDSPKDALLPLLKEEQVESIRKVSLFFGNCSFQFYFYISCACLFAWGFPRIAPSSKESQRVAFWSYLVLWGSSDSHGLVQSYAELVRSSNSAFSLDSTRFHRALINVRTFKSEACLDLALLSTFTRKLVQNVGLETNRKTHEVYGHQPALSMIQRLQNCSNAKLLTLNFRASPMGCMGARVRNAKMIFQKSSK